MGRENKPYATMKDGPDAYLFRKDGKQKLVGSADNEKCPDCYGTGDAIGFGDVPIDNCETCKGTGKVQELDEDDTPGYQYRSETDYEEDNSKIWHEGKAPGEDWEIIDRSPYAQMDKFAWGLYVDFHKNNGRWPTQDESREIEDMEHRVMTKMDENINDIRRLAGLPLLESTQLNERNPREATVAIHELMDEGMLDPRSVADACLTYMSESEVADMARMYEWFGEVDDDFDPYEESIEEGHDWEGDICKACNGAGSPDMMNQCEVCDGHGRVNRDICPDCDGKGTPDMMNMCDTCSGYGSVKKAKYLGHVESIEEDDKMDNDPCWDNYKMVGMKKKNGKEVPNCVPEGVEEFTVEDASEVFGPIGEELNEDGSLNEAEYQGRKVELNKPMQGDVKKFKVYVNSGSKTADGKVKAKKVNFGDPDMKIKKSDPGARKSFRARHNCDNPGPKTKARYWSCRKW